MARKKEVTPQELVQTLAQLEDVVSKAEDLGKRLRDQLGKGFNIDARAVAETLRYVTDLAEFARVLALLHSEGEEMAKLEARLKKNK